MTLEPEEDEEFVYGEALPLIVDVAPCAGRHTSTSQERVERAHGVGVDDRARDRADRRNTGSRCRRCAGPGRDGARAGGLAAGGGGHCRPRARSAGAALFWRFVRRVLTLGLWRRIDRHTSARE